MPNILSFQKTKQVQYVIVFEIDYFIYIFLEILVKLCLTKNR